MMRRPLGRLLLGVAGVMAVAVPAVAHHRQTPPLVQFTQSGENVLPRLPIAGQTLLLSIGAPGAREIYQVPIKQLGLGVALQKISNGGDNLNPISSRGSRLIAWDTTGSPFSGRQLQLDSPLARFPVYFNDPTGTSANPAVNRAGSAVAFESRGDLAGAGVTQGRHVYYLRNNGDIQMLSRGHGESRNPSMGGRDTLIAFDSTSHPVTGNPTGTAQIWVASVLDGTSQPLTKGLGSSEFPAISQDSHLLVFQSRAALETDGHNTGAPQIYAYDFYSSTYARVTNDAGGCTMPSVREISRDYRIAYTCSGKAYYSELRKQQRFRLPIPLGDTNRAVVEMGSHFIVISTTANLMQGGLHSGHQLYLWNLYKQPAVAVSGQVTWFPFQGMSSL